MKKPKRMKLPHGVSMVRFGLIDTRDGEIWDETATTRDGAIGLRLDRVEPKYWRIARVRISEVSK